jgi:hypothetical protein
MPMVFRSAISGAILLASNRITVCQNAFAMF